jgi:hypothetical protein
LCRMRMYGKDSLSFWYVEWRDTLPTSTCLKAPLNVSTSNISFVIFSYIFCFRCFWLCTSFCWSQGFFFPRANR